MHCKTSPGKTIIDIRMELVKCVSDEIDEKLGLKRSVSSIVQKITTLETSYRSAADWMRQTGAGVQEEGGDFRTYLLKLCPYYDQLDQVFASKVNANPLYLNEVSADVVSLDNDLLSSDGDESSVTSKTTKRKVLVPAETKESVKTLKKRSTDKKVSNTIDLLCGTDTEAAALRQVQMKAAEANAASALASVRTKEREINVSEKRYRLEEEAHSMNMRLKEIEVKHQQMKVRMEIIKMRIQF